MKKSLLVLAVVAAFAPMLAQAEAGDIVVRVRATHVSPDTSSILQSQTVSTYNQGVANNLYGVGSNAALQVDSNTIPEIDFSYYITKNIAAELILAVGTRHDVHISGMTGSAAANAALGSVNLLPPTLTAQWHFNPDQTIDPYVGAGLSYVRAMDRNLNYGGIAPIKIDRNTWGPAFQVGVDYNLENKWLVNLDVKKIWFSTDVNVDASVLGVSGFKKIDSLDIDPWVVSVGFGKKF